jgi:hypothetical protein
MSYIPTSDDVCEFMKTAAIIKFMLQHCTLIALT